MDAPKAFLIVGLPRSRTAWLAAFLTSGPVVCHHELVRSCPDLRDYVQAFSKHPIVGDSSSAIPSCYNFAAPFLPAHRIAFIMRNPEQAQAATFAMIRNEAGIEPVAERWDGIEARFNAMLAAHPEAPRYAFEDLDNEAAVKQLSEYLTGQPFDRVRYGIMKDLRVTVIPRKAYANVWAEYASTTH